MNENGHVDDAELMDYAEDSARLPNLAEVEAHLQICTECRSALDDYRVLAVALRSEETWRFVDVGSDEGSAERGAGVALAFQQRLAAEDALAENMLQTLVAKKYLFMHTNVAGKKPFRTGGVVRFLCRAAYDEVDRDPVFGQALAEAATLIAEALPDDYYPSRRARLQASPVRSTGHRRGQPRSRRSSLEATAISRGARACSRGRRGVLFAWERAALLRGQTARSSHPPSDGQRCRGAGNL